MRTIKFRGKRIDNEEWIEGYLVIDPKNNYRIYINPFEGATSNTYHFVIPETVGQFTGLTDKNGNEIYEGDIYCDKPGRNYTIVFYGCSFCKFNGASYFSLSASEIKVWQGEIIGNIHDNPELLK